MPPQNTSQPEANSTPKPHVDVRPAIADGRPFRAEIDIAELDDRGRPTTTWSGRAELLSRSQLMIMSRRLTYAGRRMVIAVHLIDAQPSLLAGTVKACEYVGEGHHQVVLDLEPAPRDPGMQAWLQGRGPRRRSA